MEQFAFQQPPKNKQLCVDDDKLFQTRGPATQNARSPMVVRRALGMSSLAEAEDRRFFRPAEYEFSPPKWTFWVPKDFWGTDFHAGTTKTSDSEKLVKIRPAVPEQSRQKKRKHRRATKT